MNIKYIRTHYRQIEKSSLKFKLTLIEDLNVFYFSNNIPENSFRASMESYPYPWLAWTSIGKLPNHQSQKWDIAQKNLYIFSWTILHFMIWIDFIIAILNEILLKITKYELAWKDWGFLQKSKYRFITSPDCGSLIYKEILLR